MQARAEHRVCEQVAALLLVEDDSDLAAMLVELLGDEGYAVDVASDGQAGLHKAMTRQYDVLIVDRRLPGIEGVDLLTRLRSRGIATPALMLTALGSAGERIDGLDAGADDYLVKPFDVGELMARLRALRRRHVDVTDRITLSRGRELEVGARRVVESDGTTVQLSAREAELLYTLAARPTQVFTRDELLGQVFADAERPGAVDTYVYYLRRKLGRHTIDTVHGLGYRLGG